MQFAPYRDHRQVAKDLKPIYTRLGDEGLHELERFEQTCANAPDHRQGLARCLAAADPFLPSRPTSARGLHRQHDRDAAPPGAQSDQNAEATTRPREAAPQGHLHRRQQRATELARACNWRGALAAFKIHFEDRRALT
jgi:hypothetical protein